MGIVVKESIKSSAISYLGIAIGFVNTILLFPKMLSLEEIGLFKLLLSICIIIMPLVQFNGSTLLTKFYSYFADDDKLKNSFFSFLFILPAFGFLVLFIVSFYFNDVVYEWLFRKNSPLVISYKWSIVPLAAFFIFSNLLEVAIFTKLKSVFATFLKTVFVRLLTTLIVVLYFFSFLSQTQLLLSFVGIYGIQFFLLLIYFFKVSNFRWTNPLLTFKSKFFSEIKSYMAFIFLGGSGAVIVSQIDSVMASSKLGLKYTGIYTIAFFMAVVIEIPRRNIIQVLAPLLTKAVKEENQEEIINLYRKTAINQFIASGLVFLLIAVSLQDIYNFIPTKDNYTDVIKGMPVFLIVGASYVFDMLMGCNTEIIHYSKLYKWNALLIPLLALLAIGLNILFLDYLDNGLVAIALATLSTIVIHNAIRASIIYIYFKSSPFSVGHLKFLVIVGLSALIGYALPDSGNKYLNILLNTAVVGGIVLWLTYTVKVSPEFNHLVLQLKKRLIKR